MCVCVCVHLPVHTSTYSLLYYPCIASDERLGVRDRDKAPTSGMIKQQFLA